MSTRTTSTSRRGEYRREPENSCAAGRSSRQCLEHEPAGRSRRRRGQLRHLDSLQRGRERHGLVVLDLLRVRVARTLLLRAAGHRVSCSILTLTSSRRELHGHSRSPRTSADQDAIDPPDTMSCELPVELQRSRRAAGRDPRHPGRLAHLAEGGSGRVERQRVVTAKRSNGYYMQDPNPDADEATSEGIFVFTSSAPSSVNVGDAVRVNGTVAEFRPGGASSTNLTHRQRSSSPPPRCFSTGNPLPAATVIGSGGRVPARRRHRGRCDWRRGDERRLRSGVRRDRLLRESRGNARCR